MATLVIGIGNPLFGDDGIGPHIAHMLLERDTALTVVPARQLLPEHADAIHRADAVIFVDASVDLPAGVIEVTPVVPLTSGGASGHHLTPARLLALVELVYGPAPPAQLIAVGVGQMGLNDPLSAAVQARIPALLALLDVTKESLRDAAPYQQ
jgi:hydrogenase maturation protease